MKLPAYKIGDHVTYRRKTTGHTGSGVIRFAYNTASTGLHYKLEGIIPTIMEDEIISKLLVESEEVEEVEENTKPTPPYLHITKKSLKQATHSTYPYSSGNSHYARNPSGHEHWDSLLSGNTGPKKYKVPVNYMVTTYVHIIADSQSEAIQKAQHIEAPQLEMWDNTAHDTTIESEVCPYEIEEIEDWK